MTKRPRTIFSHPLSFGKPPWPIHKIHLKDSFF